MKNKKEIEKKLSADASRIFELLDLDCVATIVKPGRK